MSVRYCPHCDKHAMLGVTYSYVVCYPAVSGWGETSKVLGFVLGELNEILYFLSSYSISKTRQPLSWALDVSGVAKLRYPSGL